MKINYVNYPNDDHRIKAIIYYSLKNIEDKELIKRIYKKYRHNIDFYHGDRTYITFIGKSCCNHNDKYDQKIGKKIARYKVLKKFNKFIIFKNENSSEMLSSKQSLLELSK